MPDVKATKIDPGKAARVRFAPSPNGLLHLGHARSALINWRVARQYHGTFLLRIEDIDTTRARPEFEQAIFEDLAWLGLDWPKPVRRQSDHSEDYQAALKELQKLGLLYPAFMSRAEAAHRVRESQAAGSSWPTDPDGAPHYPPDDKNLSDTTRNRRIADGDPHSWRLDMQAAVKGLSTSLTWQEWGPSETPQSQTLPTTIPADPLAWGDVVLARRDTPTSYHLAVTVDDALQAITMVIRGQDLWAATSVHRLLQSLLGLPEPAYLHHSLITDDQGRKLSKSDGDIAISAYRARGFEPKDIIAMAGLDPVN